MGCGSHVSCGRSTHGRLLQVLSIDVPHWEDCSYVPSLSQSSAHFFWAAVTVRAELPEEKVETTHTAPCTPKEKNSNTKKKTSTIRTTNMNDMICPSIAIHPWVPTCWAFPPLKIPDLLLSLAIILPNDSHLLPEASRVSGGNPYRKLPTKTVQAYPQGHIFNV